MSRTVTIELTDELYQAIEHAAETAALPATEWIATTLRQQFPSLDLNKRAFAGY